MSELETHTWKSYRTGKTVKVHFKRDTGDPTAMELDGPIFVEEGDE